MLTRAQKEEQVADLRDKFGRATSVFVTDHCGLTVQEVCKLRQDLRGDEPGESEYRVSKNCVLRRAVAESDLEVLTDHFTGPSSIAISYGDPVRIAKVLVECAKEVEAFEVKGGFLDGKALGEAEVAKLATLPSLLELRGKLVGLIQAPATKLVRIFSEPGSQLARLVAARRSALEDGDS